MSIPPLSISTSEFIDLAGLGGLTEPRTHQFGWSGGQLASAFPALNHRHVTHMAALGLLNFLNYQLNH